MRARAVIALLVLGSASAAAGQDSERDEEARVLFQAGEAAYGDGRYKLALERFEAAHAMSPRPELLFNIASTADRLRKEELAIEAYESYLEALPEASNASEVRSRLAILRHVVVAREAETEPEDPPEDSEGSAHGSTPVFGWVFGATAVAFAGLSLTFGLVADGDFDSFAEGCQARGGCTEHEIDDASPRRWQRLSNAFLGLSLAATAASIVGFVIGLRDDSRSGLSLRVSPGSLSLTSRF